MISDGTFIEFECAVSEDKHFIKQPIILPSCGHSICKQCLPKEANFIKCKLCSEITNRDLSNDKEAISLKISFKRNLENLFHVIENQTRIQLDKLKSYSDQNEKINSYVNYINDEIDIRVESLKLELEKIGEELKSDLIKLTDDIIKVNTKLINEKSDEIQIFEAKFEKLKNDMKKYDQLTDIENYFYESQNNLIKLNKLNKDFENLDFKLDLELPKKNLDKRLLGKIIHTNLRQELMYNANIREQIRSAQYTINDLEIRPFDSIILPNDLILFANRDDKKLTLCDDNFRIIKTIDKIENRGFYPEAVAVALDGPKRIYFTNRDSHEVIMTDLNLNKIKSFGSIGLSNCQFNDPCGICYIEGFVYVCDSKNERIQVLNSDLEYCKSVPLDYEPWLIKGSNNVVCIERNDGQGISFYNLIDNFSLIKHYHHGWGKISNLNGSFFECCVKKKRIYCYDEEGSLIEEINIDRFDNIISNSWDGYLFSFKNNLLMLCYNKRKIIQFN